MCVFVPARVAALWVPAATRTFTSSFGCVVWSGFFVVIVDPGFGLRSMGCGAG
jgi:hypothetical protein